MTEAKGTQPEVDSYTSLVKTYNASAAFSDAHYFTAGGTLASFGLFTLTLKPKAGGSPTVESGRFSDVAIWSRGAQGGWRHVIDHASVPTGS